MDQKNGESNSGEPNREPRVNFSEQQNLSAKLPFALLFNCFSMRKI